MTFKSEFARRAAGPMPGQPGQQPQDPQAAADLKTDPWGALSQALGDEAPGKPQGTPQKPPKHTVEPEIPGGPYHMIGAKDAYCDACDRPESQCVCSPKDCDMTRMAAPAVAPAPEQDVRLPGDSPEVDYKELKGAWKDADCAIIRVPGGISLELGCCNKFQEEDENVQQFKCGTCEFKMRRTGGMRPRLGNIVTIVGAAKAAEGNMQKSSRELLREKIGAIAEDRKAQVFGRMKAVAVREPKKVAEALGELAYNTSLVAASFASLQKNLDLTSTLPKNASLRVRMAARRKFAAEFRRVADKNPEVLADAIAELYKSMDEIVAGLENLASNLGVELPEENDLETAGEALETPEQQATEDTLGSENTEADKVQDEELAAKEGSENAFTTDRDETGDPKEVGKMKNRTANGGFVTNRDQSGEPKQVETTDDVPRSQGEAAIKQQ